MASWEQSYLEHPLWQAVADALTALDTGREAVPDHNHDEADRVRFVLAYLGDMAGTAQPLVSQGSLDTCRGAVVTLTQVLTQWRDSHEPTVLSDAAGNRTEVVLEAMRGWPVSKDRYAKGVIAAADEFITTANAEAGALRELVTALTAEVAELRTQLGTDRDASEQLATATRLEVDKQKARLDDALNGFQQTFSTAEAERATAHTAAMTAQAKEAGDFRDHLDEVVEADRRRWDDQAQVALDHLEAKKKEVDDLVAVVAVTGTATQYRSYAKEERTAANFWRWVAAGAFGLAFVVFLVMLFAVGGGVTGETPWQLVVFKVTGSVGLLALGAYAARESASHRKAERAAKTIDLDLAALEPFITNLPENEKAAIRLGAAKRLFAPATVDDPAPPAVADAATEPDKRPARKTS